MYGGTPQEVPQNYLKNSSFFHSAGATTPILFFMGNQKLRGGGSYDMVNMLYKVLKAQKVETKYVKYSDEGHVFNKPVNLKDMLERSVQWIDSHMKIKDKA